MTIGEEMEIGHFYYIDDQYFKDFPDSYLMQNKSYIAICLQAESYMNTLLKLILRRVIWRSI